MAQRRQAGSFAVALQAFGAGMDADLQATYATRCDIGHTRLFNQTTAAPGMFVVRGGVLEGAERFAPVAHIWTRRKHPWLVLPDEVVQWEERPTPEEFSKTLE